MLQIYISLEFTLVVREARPGPLPVPEKRFCGTYWLYSYDSGNEAVQNELCHPFFSLRAVKALMSTSGPRQKRQQSTSSLRQAWQLPRVWTQNKLKHGLLPPRFHLSVILQHRKGGKSAWHGFVPLSDCAVWTFYFGHSWRRQPWLSWHLWCDRAASPPPHDCWHWRSVSFHYNTHRLSCFR